MKNMVHRAIEHMEQDRTRAYTLTELRKAARIAIRSQYRLSAGLLASEMVVRGDASKGQAGRYVIAPWLLRD